MKYSSGLLLSTGDRWLLAERSSYVDNPHVWSVPGGGVPRDHVGLMPVLPSACREFWEEMGARPPLRSYLRGRCQSQSKRKHFTTYVLHVPRSAEQMGFRPNFETGEYGWIRIGDLDRLPLHKKFASALPDLIRLGVFSPSDPPHEGPLVRALMSGVEGGRSIGVGRQRQLEAMLEREFSAVPGASRR